MKYWPPDNQEDYEASLPPELKEKQERKEEKVDNYIKCN